MHYLHDIRELRSSFSREFKNAKILLWLRSAEQAISNHHFDIASRRLVSGALELLGQVSGDSWTNHENHKKFASLLVSVALKSQDIKVVGEAASVSRRLDPSLLSEGLQGLEGSFSDRYLICKIIVDAFPEDVSARLHLAANAELAEESDEKIALLFTRARDLMDRTDLGRGAMSGKQIQGMDLHTGVALLKVRRLQEGREIVLRLDRRTMSGGELLWLVHGLVRTRKWLDRLRAFDLLVDLNTQLIQERLPDHALTRHEWASGFYDFLNMLPVKLKGQEIERYEEEASLFPEPYLNALLECTTFRKNLEQEDSVLDSIKDLILPKEMSDVRLAIVSGDKDFLERSCLELARTYTKGKDLPIALLWPFLLTKEHAIEEETIAILAEKFSNQARCPSYGWASLAGKLFSLKYPRAGSFIAKRMVVEKEKHELTQRVIESALKQALRCGDENNLLFWLDAFKDSSL